jgi:hypothetical protein
MCHFKLEVCPYPHHDPISALIFLPTNASLWQACEEPKPWGRLSCGNLIIKHINDASKSQASPMTDCKWCTLVLKLVATKSKEIQAQASKELKELEQRMNADQELVAMRMGIEALEKKLAEMRSQLWGIRLANDIDGGSGEWEQVNGEM